MTRTRCGRARSCAGRCDYRRDDGSATIFVVGALAVLLLVALAVTVRTAAVAARHRAEGAADLAALAGAGRIGLTGPPCDAASRVASANGADLRGCRVTLNASGRSGTVDVTVVAAVRLPITGSQTITAHARAGRLPATDQPAPVNPAGQPSPAGAPTASSTTSSSVTAPALSSGSLPLPHLGDWTHDGQPAGHSHAAIASRVARNHEPRAA